MVGLEPDLDPVCPQQDGEEREVDTGTPPGLQGVSEMAPKPRTWLTSRFRVAAHWLLVAAGRALAVLLLALAGTLGGEEPGC